MMHKTHNTTLAVFITLLILSACGGKSNTSGKKSLPHSIGNMGELIVAADDKLFEGTMREALDSVLDVPQPYFFNIEGYFRVKDTRPALFKEVTKSYHTLWIVKVEGDNFDTRTLPSPYDKLSDSLQKINDSIPVRTYLKKNIWAYPQQVLFIYAKSHAALYNFFVSNRKMLLSQTLKMEMESGVVKMEADRQDTISQFLGDKFGFSLAVPEKFRIAKYEEASNKRKFAWIRRETPNIGQSIIVYTQPYTDTLQLVPEEIVLSRDSVTEMHIPGGAEGSFMTTELSFPFYNNVMEFAGMYAVQMRALWRTENDFMGGPFYSITMVDTKHKQLLTVEGFVYCPRYDKTQYIRQLEAIIKTFKWVD